MHSIVFPGARASVVGTNFSELCLQKVCGMFRSIRSDTVTSVCPLTCIIFFMIELRFLGEESCSLFLGCECPFKMAHQNLFPYYLAVSVT